MSKLFKICQRILKSSFNRPDKNLGDFQMTIFTPTPPQGLRIQVTPNMIRATAPTKIMTPVGSTILSNIPMPREIAHSPFGLQLRNIKSAPCVILLPQFTQRALHLCLLSVASDQQADAIRYFDAAWDAAQRFVADPQGLPTVKIRVGHLVLGAFDRHAL